MFRFLYAYSYDICLCFSRHSGCAVTKAVARMVTRFTAIKNRFIFRLRKIVGGELPLETETCRFVLISLLDLFMTFLLLYFSNRGMMRNVVVESNPVARYFISGWGTLGLVWFKIAMVTLIVLATQVVATRRPVVAQLVLNGATLFVGSVVAYSAFLLVQNWI